MERTAEITTGDAVPRTRVLIVDDDQAISRLMERFLGRERYAVAIVQDGAAALAAVVSDPPDVILLDVLMPGSDGYSVCRALKNDPATRLIPVVMITGLADRASRIAAIAAGADDFLTKPVDAEELQVRVRSLARIKRYTDDLDSASGIVMALAAMIEARLGGTEGHCHRLANHATALGRRLGLGASELEALHRGGFLHDIGMLAVPDSLLNRPGPLQPAEFELVKSHTIIGDDLCRHLRALQGVRPIVRHHHERFDGSGYPDGLSGDDIPIIAQIIGVVDVYDGLTTGRPYQSPHSVDEALALLGQHVERGWHAPALVEHFSAIVRSGRLETFARSSSTIDVS